MYYIVYSFLYVLSLMPLRMLYAVSDLLYLIIYRMAAYRKKIVRTNLKNSFPNKTEDELTRIEKNFYHWFCDYIVETVKMFSMSDKEMYKRMQFDGVEQINREVEAGHSVTLYLGHYCNWEWITSLSLRISPIATSAQLYHPIENKIIDRLFLYSRERFGAKSLEMKEALGILRSWQKEGQLSVTGYISDQVPGYSSMHYWPKFLNQDTPTYTGAERIARLLNTPVYYIDIFRPKRGYYVAKVIKICDEPRKEEKFSITASYYRLLEESILRHPQYWLWSHNRWKRQWKDFVECFPDEQDRKRILNKL